MQKTCLSEVYRYIAPNGFSSEHTFYHISNFYSVILLTKGSEGPRTGQLLEMIKLYR